MRLVPYTFDELAFAYVYHVYLRWQTHRRRQVSALADLDAASLGELADRHGIHVLACEAMTTESRLLISLRPDESIATAVSKLKGQTAKWLNERSGGRLARGYFACTSGKSAAAQIEAYLTSQSEHHGYSHRPLPPVFVKAFECRASDETRLASPHAKTLSRFHIVLATWWRRGTFRSESGHAVSERWRTLEESERFALLKVSFVPDHVHLAVRTPPLRSAGRTCRNTHERRPRSRLGAFCQRRHPGQG
jgi:REP element-mobilizing transposase RayT